MGQSSVPILLGSLTVNCPVLVTKNLTQPCLLGADFLNEQRCLIDLNEKVLKIGKERVPLAPDGGHVPVTCHVAAVETSTIPSKHQMQVPVYVLDGKLQHLEQLV